jgi:hypothetical protein
MLDKKDTFSLNILPDGQVNVQRESKITENGVVISNSLWNCVFEPGQFTEARAILPDYEYGIIQAAWTQEKITAYQEAKAASMS